MPRFVAVAIFLALTFALPFVWWGDRFEDAFGGDGAVRWLREIGPSAWLGAIALLIADLVLPIPSSAVMAALGIVYGPWWGGLIATVGSIASGLIGYGIGRLLGRPVAQRLVGERMLDYGNRLFAGFGGWVVALSRWQPILPEVVACLAGLSRMRLGFFLLALACGSVPLGFTFAALGHAGAQRPLATMLVSALAPLLLWALMQPLLRRRAGRP